MKKITTQELIKGDLANELWREYDYGDSHGLKY